jgi:nicotinate-nucleotide adenylyltransferase
MRLGIFGGTFDPPHVGHLIVAQDAAVALDLDRVLFVPAGTPPHKRDRALTAGDIRLAMIRAATAGNGRFDVDALELERGEGPSYTVDTLRALADRHPGAELWLLIGCDQWDEFSTWRASEEVLRLASVGVMSRGGEERGPGPESRDRVRFIDVTRIDVSSTEIRRRVGVGESVRYLVPDPVIEIIFRERLYR